jgi:hypothetical protein
MANQPSLSAEDRANLVAYLDGELNAPTARCLEAKLQQDPRARAEADSLRRTWELLDYLPRPEPSSDFSTRTIERVSALRPAAGRARRRAVAGWVAAGLLAAIVGFAAGRFVPHPASAGPLAGGEAIDPGGARDRRLLENLPRYLHVDDLHFLQRLADPKDPDLFGDGGRTPGPALPAARPQNDGVDARLRQNLEAFRALPPERQADLRRLDDELYQQPPAVLAQLDAVLDRYADWFDRLPEAERQRLEQAPDADGRLVVIKEVRQRQWIERLPRAERFQVERAQGDERAAVVQRIRRQDQQRHQEWRQAAQRWTAVANAKGKAKLEACPPAVRVFVKDYLEPLLTFKQRQQLEEFDGHWSGFLSNLARLADSHKVILLGRTGPTRFEELPADVRQQLAALDTETRARLRDAEGRWPDYAIWVTVAAKNKRIKLKTALGACSPGDERFDRVARDFIGRLTARLGQQEKWQLQSAEGQWPEYPLLLQRLAPRHYMVLPPGGSRFHLPYFGD